MNGRRATVRECAQKNGKIDENSNEDKEEIDAKSYISGYIDDDVTDGDDEDGENDDDDDENANGNANDGDDNNNFGSIDEVIIMGIERQMPASDVVESSAPKQTSTILNTVTVTAVPNATSSKVHRRFQCFQFCRLLHDYQRQINSIIGGFVLLLATGFHILWGLNKLYDHRNDKYLKPMIFAMVAIYYVGAIAGTVLSAFLLSIVRKRTIHDIGACIGLFSCLLFQVSNGNEVALMFGRVLGGCFHGLIYLPTIVHAAENSSKRIRHIALLINSYIFGLGIIIAAQLRLPPYTSVTSETLVAIHSFIVILCGIVITHIFTKESPVFLLHHQKIVYEEDLSEAYDTFTNLQKKHVPADDIEHDFDEIKTMLANESQLSRNPFTDGNLKPTILCGCIRLVALLSFNLPLIIEVLASEKIIACDEHTGDKVVINLVLWFCCGIIAICVLHYIGKKHLLYLYSTIFGISLTFVRILSIFDLRYSLTFYLPAVLLLFYFYIVSLPLEMASNIYLSEAFATPKKPFSLAVIVTVEHCVHLLLLIMYFMRWDHWILLVTSLGLMGMSFKVYWSLPRDTNGVSLQQSVYAFRTAIVREWYSQANINSRCVV